MKKEQNNGQKIVNHASVATITHSVMKNDKLTIFFIHDKNYYYDFEAIIKRIMIDFYNKTKKRKKWFIINQKVFYIHCW